MSKGTFALVHKSDIRNFIKNFNGCDIEGFDKALANAQFETIFFRHFEATPDKNLFIFQRQSTVQKNTDIKTFEQHLNSAVDYSNTSMFFLSSYIHCNQTFPQKRLSKENIEIIQRCYKSSSFARSINHSLGLNIYQGKRSSLCNTSPLCGYSNRDKFHFNSIQRNLYCITYLWWKNYRINIVLLRSPLVLILIQQYQCYIVICLITRQQVTQESK